jgi:hypothetical protein
MKKYQDVDNVLFYQHVESQLKIPYIRVYINMAKSDTK